jgi:cell division protein ZapA (FtsZ GTPase activity inhibitor)
MDNKFTINLTIADKRYPLNINRSDEELVRAAAKLVNDWIAQYRNRFKIDEAGLELRDLLAMAACQIAIRALKAEQSDDGKVYSSTIGQLDKELEEILR